MKKLEGRFLCWDDKLIESSSNIDIRMHQPEKKNLALICDDEWEGPHNCYGSVIKVGDTYRMYYESAPMRHMMDKTISGGTASICVALSKDGITFEKPNIGKYDYNGTKYNNIIFRREEYTLDNFSVFYDTNPACPADEKFKALSEVEIDGISHLYCYVSEDGFDFREKSIIPTDGTYDSFNVLLWDSDSEQYVVYYRGFHNAEGENVREWAKLDLVNDVRVIRRATSKDFENWTLHGDLKYEEGQEEYPMYVNQINKYYRAPDMFIGLPFRYRDRAENKRNFDFMPLADRHQNITRLFGREGTVLTDCVIMTSYDGQTFDRRDEAFITPGIEARNNWWYGNCETIYGFVETKSDIQGAPNEISFYMGEGLRIKDVHFRRYTVRLDGFFSWYGKYSGGEVLTKTFEMGECTQMRLNFATSAVGGVVVAICDENGEAIEGYESYTIFGDTVDRPVEFEKPLSELAGKTVRLRFNLSEAHLYSFIFE